MQAQLHHHQLGVCAERRHFSPPAVFPNHRCFFPRDVAFLPRSPLLSLSRIRLSATLQENTADSSAGTDLVKVKFVLQRRCEFGQQFNLVGDNDGFGAWNPEASIPMQWSEGHVWTTEMEVSVGKRVEYKVILMGGEGVVDWQPGPNRVLEPSEPLSSPVVLETQWGEDDSFCEDDIQLNRSADLESLREMAAPGQMSSEALMDFNGMAFPPVGSDGTVEERKVDIHGETAVDGAAVETVNEVQEQLAAGLASENAKANTKREPTVLEKDLQWSRQALSMLWSALTQKSNNTEV